MEIKKELLTFEEGEPIFTKEDRGFAVKAFYLEDDEELGIKGDAFIEVSYQNKEVREFLFPAYKVFNIAAHFSDIVDGELSKTNKERGYRIAGSDGLGGQMYNG